MNYALTIHPMSPGFRQALEQVIGTRPTYIDYADLRRLSPLAMLRRLRSLGASRLFIPLEDESSRCILPLLNGLAAVSDASLITVVDHDLRSEVVPRWSAGWSTMALLAASAASSRDMAACAAEVRNFLSLPRRQVGGVRGRGVLYINATVAFGLVAGGSVGHVAGVVNALHDEGLDVTLASQVATSMAHASVPRIPLSLPRAFGLPFEKSSYTFQRMVVGQLERELQDARPAFIYQRMSLANYAGVALSRRWGIPLVLEYNGSEVWVAKNWGRGARYAALAADVESVCLRHADLVVTVSEVLAAELVERGVARERIVSYPNCVDPALFDPRRFDPVSHAEVRAQMGLSADAVLIMFIGTFGQWHGVEVLTQAIRAMVNRDAASLRLSKAHFALIGDGLAMPAVREGLSAAPYRAFVTLTGLVPQADAPRYLAAADVVVSPHVGNSDGSKFFGSPTKLFEYMAMGKAIVASDLDQIGEILRPSIQVADLPSRGPGPDERRLAVLCKPGDVDALAQGIAFAIGDAPWRAVLGRNARAEALARYTWRHHVAAVLAGLDSLPNAHTERVDVA